ncbi:MAG: hypothetical protein ABIL49_04215 [candidate division WOR-3 bacterium]
MLDFKILIILLILSYFEFKADNMEITRTDKGYVYKLRGDVFIKTENYEIYSQIGTYYEDLGISELSGNVLVKGKDYFLKSNYLRYIQKNDELYLSGNVHLEDSIRIIKAKEVHVKNNFSRAKKDVYIYLKDKKIASEGDSGNYDLNKKEGKIFNVKYIKIFRDSDTVDIRTHYVDIFKENLKLKPLISLKTMKEFAKGDSLTYEMLKDSTEKITIYNNAFISWENGEGKADTIIIYYKHSKIENAQFINNADVKTKTQEDLISVKSNLVNVEFFESKVKRVICNELIEGISEKIK